MPPALPVAPYQLRPVMRGIAALGQGRWTTVLTPCRQSPATTSRTCTCSSATITSAAVFETLASYFAVPTWCAIVARVWIWDDGGRVPPTAALAPTAHRGIGTAPAQLPPGTSETPNSMEPSSGLELTDSTWARLDLRIHGGDIARRTEKPEIMRVPLHSTKRHREFVSSARGMLSMSGDTSGSAESHKASVRACAAAQKSARRRRKLQKLKIYEKRLEVQACRKGMDMARKDLGPRARVGN